MYHRRVSGRHVGANPVAQAIAKAKLHSAILDQQLRIYLMEDGEPCAELCEGVGMTLAVVGYASELSGLGDTPQNRVLRGGLSACQQMLLADKWNGTNATAVSNALDAAEQLNRQVRPDFINRAWKSLNANLK